LLGGHGQAAMIRAINRMADSLERRGLDFLRNQDRMLAADGGRLELHSAECGVNVHRTRLPDSLNSEVFPTKYMRPFTSPRMVPNSSGGEP
jgi:hypothetical protein